MQTSKENNIKLIKQITKPSTTQQSHYRQADKHANKQGKHIKTIEKHHQNKYKTTITRKTSRQMQRSKEHIEIKNVFTKTCTKQQSH